METYKEENKGVLAVRTCKKKQKGFREQIASLQGKITSFRRDIKTADGIMWKAIRKTGSGLVMCDLLTTEKMIAKHRHLDCCMYEDCLSIAGELETICKQSFSCAECEILIDYNKVKLRKDS